MQGTTRQNDPQRSVSWRWRVLLPVFLFLLVGVIVVVYGLTPGTGAAAGSMAPDAQRQLTGLTLASLAAGVVIFVFVGLNLLLERVRRVTAVAEGLAAGESALRTRMQPTDEVGALGAALDRYADYVQERQDVLRASLRRQRREIAHIMAVLESLPEGVIVQDLDGRVMLMNEHARELLGSQRVLENASLEALTAVVTDVLGPSLAPGLYALGDPRRVELDGRMLSAQAAAVTTLGGQTVGTVIILRDITDAVRRARAREALAHRMTREVQMPLAEAGRALAVPGITSATFAREMARSAVTLQKLIVEMRELTSDLSGREMKRGQRPLPVDTLIWAVANEWRQVAQAANLRLDVRLEQSGLYILGDERRLRWALGNVVDNAIKYTPPGGALSIEVKGDNGSLAHLRVRDNGVGMAPDELPHVFTRFFRGNPVTEGGRVLRVPGTGQGLTIARQIIEAHGGTISVRSTRWVGTAVYITLPLTSSVSLELPHGDQAADLEGETVRLNVESQRVNGEPGR